jgi:hypothetical protein
MTFLPRVEPRPRTAGEAEREGLRLPSRWTGGRAAAFVSSWEGVIVLQRTY